MKINLKCFLVASALFFLIPHLHCQVLINEISFRNDTTILDEYGETEDWIELYNAGATPINLFNYVLSDDIGDLNKWRFPNISLPAHSHLLLMASGNNKIGATYIHLNFKLDAAGETITLCNATGIVLDQYSFGPLQLDHSYGRSPDGSATWCVFNKPSPNATNNPSICYTGYAPDPYFSISSGFYPTTQAVAINSTSGTSNIKYSLTGDVNALSPSYTAVLNINNTAILTAINIGTGSLLSSNKIKSTYFINEDSLDLPIFSISMDPDDLWSSTRGLYATGATPGPFPYLGANYWQDWTRACNVEYFDKNKNKAFEVGAGLKINGGYSRLNPQKSFRVNLKSKYGASSVNYPLIPDKGFITNYESIELKNSGTDGKFARLRDGFSQRMMKNTHNDYIAYEPALVFLNGEYWGEYEIKERQDAKFIEINNGVSADKVDYLATKWVTDYSQNIIYNGSDTGFVNLHNYVMATPPTNPSFYSTMNNKLDIKNVTDYLIAQLYFDNWDWLTPDWTANNIKLWRPQAPGGKWRYVLFDLDYTSDFPDGHGTTNTLLTTLRHNPNPNIDSYHTDIFNALFLNTQFSNDFINRYADLMNTTFQFPNIQKVAYGMRDSLRKVMPRHIRKWGHASTTWLADVDRMVNFHLTQPNNVRNNLITEFNLVKKVDVTLDVLPAGAGRIQISTITPDNLPWTGIYFDGVPVTMTAIPNPGYTFNHWQTNGLITTNDTNNIAITLNINKNNTFTAHFNGTLHANPLLTFTELNYHSDSSKEAGDWIELYNNDIIPVDLTGWSLKNSDGYKTFELPFGTVLGPNEYIVFCNDTQKFIQQHPTVTNVVGQLPFNFKNSSDKISLYDFKDSLKLALNYLDTWAKCADGNGRTMELTSPSANINNAASWFDGCMNGSPGVAYTPCNEPVIFNEINYNSLSSDNAGDWVELYNTSLSDIDISGWNFKDNKDIDNFFIPANTILRANKYLVICGDSANFRLQHPTISNRVGNFNFNLEEDGELIRIYNAAGKLQYSMIYDDNSPWPLEADGLGKTLEINNSQGIVNKGTNWFAGCPKGSPGKIYNPNCSSIPQLITLFETQINEITFYPNPSNGIINLSFKGNKEIINSIAIYNSIGKQIYFSEKFQEAIDLSNNPSGIYLVQITTGNLSTNKIISIAK